jgi:N6-L-threonylcarbamoyladenine synthase
MLVYVINKDRKALMPCSTRKARLLLKEKKAIIFKREPFTIQLINGSSGYTQEINLGVDAGSKFVGVSATTKDKELFAGELQLRTDIVSLLSTKKQNRRNRRSHKTRYRQSRFLNRVKSKYKGWLPPSVENKINAHIKLINIITKILPIKNIIVETTSFDIQRIKSCQVGKSLKDNQLGFSNVREYVLWRDKHKCQGKKGCKNFVLQVHHIESRKTGGDAPDNLITLCKECHDDFHTGQLKIKFKRSQSTRDMAFMGIMRKTLFERLSKLYDNIYETYGYITKYTRIENNLEKSHRIDAKCISGNPLSESLKYYFYIRQTRKHNRQIHKAKMIKGSRKMRAQCDYACFGFRLYDKVLFDGARCFIFSRRTRDGSLQLRFIDGTLYKDYVGHKKVRLLSHRNTFLYAVI